MQAAEPTKRDGPQPASLLLRNYLSEMLDARDKSASNMTTEAVIAKMMWALANSETREEYVKLFCTPVGKDQL